MSQTSIEFLKWVMENYGFQAGLIIIFLIRDIWRDRKQDGVISALQKEFRDVLVPIVKNDAEVLSRNTMALYQCETTLKQCQETLKEYREALEATQV